MSSVACVEVSISAPSGHNPYVCPQRTRMSCCHTSVQTVTSVRLRLKFRSLDYLKPGMELQSRSSVIFTMTTAARGAAGQGNSCGEPFRIYSDGRFCAVPLFKGMERPGLSAKPGRRERPEHPF